jgi:hypothetical protein
MTNGDAVPDVSRGTSAVGDVVLGIVERMKARYVEVRCPGCSETFTTRGDAPRDLCETCERGKVLKAESDRILANMDSWLPRWMLNCGMSVRETRATLDGIPSALITRLKKPTYGIDRLLAGAMPESGFGISGPAGTGKTMALAALFRANAAARWRLRGASEGLRATFAYLTWLHWPVTVNDMRVRSTRDGGLEEVDAMMRRYTKAEALVIDDLGAERIRSDYGEDWMTSQLDLLVDRRYNDMRPTWFTTNLSVEGLIERYGERLISRLVGGNALLVYNASEDLRLAKEK